MSVLKTTCCVPNSWLVNFIGVASILESLAFMVAFSQMLADIQAEKIQQPDPVSLSVTSPRAEVVCGVGIIVNGLRLFIALAFLIGRYYMQKIGALIFFAIATVFGIVSNIVTGAFALSFTVTYDAGVAHIAIIAIHIIYIIIVTKIIRQEFAIALSTNSRALGHAPNASPFQATVTVGSVEVEPGFYDSQAPPSYEEHPQGKSDDNQKELDEGLKGMCANINAMQLPVTLKGNQINASD